MATSLLALAEVGSEKFSGRGVGMRSERGVLSALGSLALTIVEDLVAAINSDISSDGVEREVALRPGRRIGDGQSRLEKLRWLL